MTKKSELSIEEIVKKNKKTRLIIKLVILLLIFFSVFLFFFKKNVIPTDFYLNGDKNIKVFLGDKYTDEGYVAKLFGKDISDQVKSTNDIDYEKIGDYKIEYELNIKYLNIYKKITRHISVVDGVPPELNVECDDEILWNLGEEFEMPSYTASDNIDGDITGKVEVDSNVNINEEGDYRIIYKVSDSSGNESTREIKIKVEEKFKNTYILVVKSEQMIYYYEKGQLMLSSPVVTGSNEDTPTGEFYINSKLPQAHLVGPGGEWDCWVNWWMAYIGSSHGFHDSYWRDEYGGDVWLYNPTHGCISLPQSKAYELYHMVEVGTPVHIVY